MADFIRNIHYYLDGDKVIFTEKWLAQRGECCGNKCKHCPFIPKHQKGSTQVNEKLLTKEE
jgi:hypothetical protein